MESQRLDIVQLINNSPICNLTEKAQTILLEKIQQTFTDDQQQMFVASFYTFLNYNPKNDFVIGLDDVWKWCGFSRKDHCKRVLNKHFSLGVDYKKLLPQNEEHVCTDNARNLGGAGANKETILMNIETFKSLCMLACTSKSRQIRQYYLKLEELLQETLKEQLEYYEQSLQEHQKQLKAKESIINELVNKPETIGFLTRRPGYNYVIKDVSRPGHYKIGFAENMNSRLSALNTSSSTRSLEIVYRIHSNDKELSEKLIHNILQPFRIKNANQKHNEWFYLKDNSELAFAIKTLNECVMFTNQYVFHNIDTFKCHLISQNIDLEQELKRFRQSKSQGKHEMTTEIINEYVTSQTISFRGVTWVEEKKRWKAEFQYNCKRIFLGYFIDQVDGAKAYNDYALFLNQTENANLELNDIPGYQTTARNIPELNKMKEQGKKSSTYNGVSYDTTRKLYVAGIKFQKKTYNLGQNANEVECAKLYNQQAMYFNITFKTKYNLNDIDNYVNEPKDLRESLGIPEKTSKYFGVSRTRTGKWACSYMLNKKKIHIGTFNSEIEACRAYNLEVTELNKNGCTYKINACP